MLAIAEHAAFVISPAADRRRTPQPWVWYAPTLPGLPSKAEAWMFERFLAAGVAIAGVEEIAELGLRSVRGVSPS